MIEKCKSTFLSNRKFPHEAESKTKMGMNSNRADEDQTRGSRLPSDSWSWDYISCRLINADITCSSLGHMHTTRRSHYTLLHIKYSLTIICRSFRLEHFHFACYFVLFCFLPCKAFWRNDLFFSAIWNTKNTTTVINLLYFILFQTSLNINKTLLHYNF